MTRDVEAASTHLGVAPPPPLRRDARAAPSAGLPTATPVPHPAVAPSHASRVHRGRLIVGFALIAAIGAGATGVLVAGISDPDAVGVDAIRPGAAAFIGDRGRADGSPFDGRPADGAPLADPPVSPPAGDAEVEPDAPGETPDSDGGAVTDPSQPGTPMPGTDAPAPAPAPSGPAPSTPPPTTSSPAPQPSTPAPQPTPKPSQPTPKPSQPAPQPTTPPPPAAPDPLAFVGLTPNYGFNLLGIRLLSSYTLSLSGEPGSRASVTYASRSAGSVTFDSRGRASLTIGGSLLDTSLSNPLIRVSYSDGTAGAAIEARRDSI